VQRLRGRGIPVDVTSRAEVLPADADLVVASAAIEDDHPQLAEARRRGLDVWKYADLVGALMADREGVSVAGTHGKTTTSAIVASCLRDADRDPAFLVGGDLREIGSGAGIGDGPHFVAEACEYDRSFHRHRPRIAVITNVDADHLDYYRDLEEIREAFRLFAALVPADGRIVVHETCADLFAEDPRVVAPLETYGFGEHADWRVGEPYQLGPTGRTSFGLAWRGQPLDRFEVPLLGRHNALNAAAAAAALSACGLAVSEIAHGLRSFGGVGRRLEVVADRGGVLVLDDYGHHPAEIHATLAALRGEYTGRRVIVVFQPHQASRTRRLLGEFAEALAGADEVWLPPIYYARDSEHDRREVSSGALADGILTLGGRARALDDFEAVLEYALKTLRAGDVVVTMGAGNVDEVARGLADRLS
jgi:UDP-N-acetylmuramate--alanine ligase